MCAVVEVRILCVMTTRRRDEQDVVRSERWLRSLVDSLPQLVWAAHPDGRAVDRNLRWYQRTGLTPEQTLGYGWADAVQPGDRGRWLDSWQRAPAPGVISSASTASAVRDGSYCCFLDRGLPSHAPAAMSLNGPAPAQISKTRSGRRRQSRSHTGEGPVPAVLSHESRTPLSPVLIAAPPCWIARRRLAPSARP